MSLRTFGKHTMGLAWIAGLLSCNSSLAGERIPLPFQGTFTSKDSTAWQHLTAKKWQAIPQDVDIQIIHEGDIIQLTVNISVHADSENNRSADHYITNRMWLVSKPPPPDSQEPGRVDFDVYKLSPASNDFQDLGDGYCKAFECRYSYISNQQRQRYDSHLTWQKHQAGRTFKQTGGLSTRSDDESHWKRIKKWSNEFRRKQAPVRF